MPAHRKPHSRSGSGTRGGFPSSPSPSRSYFQGVPTDREEDGDEGERGRGWAGCHRALERSRPTRVRRGSRQRSSRVLPLPAARRCRPPSAPRREAAEKWLLTPYSARPASLRPYPPTLFPFYSLDSFPTPGISPRISSRLRLEPRRLRSDRTVLRRRLGRRQSRAPRTGRERDRLLGASAPRAARSGRAPRPRTNADPGPARTRTPARRRRGPLPQPCVPARGPEPHGRAPAARARAVPPPA